MLYELLKINNKPINDKSNVAKNKRESIITCFIEDQSFITKKMGMPFGIPIKYYNSIICFIDCNFFAKSSGLGKSFLSIDSGKGKFIV